MRRRALCSWSGCALLAASIPRLVGAQEIFPKVITLVVPQAPGGSNDVMARAIAAHLPKFIESSVVVDNRQGAGGNLGSAWVAKSAPKDGSAWLVTVNSTMTINPYLYSKPGFDAAADFVPVAGIAVVPHVLVARSESPISDLKGLIDAARSSPGAYSYGSAGNGTFSHLLMELLKQSKGLDMAHIPYKGVAPAMTDLIGGRVQFLISTVPAALPFIKGGQIKAIAVPSETRAKALPGVPLASDSVPGMVGDLWVAVYAPRGTPSTLVESMNQALRKVLLMPELVQLFEVQGASAMNVGSSELVRMASTEVQRWGLIVKNTGMRID